MVKQNKCVHHMLLLSLV